jgi:predicted ferric reductase
MHSSKWRVSWGLAVASLTLGAFHYYLLWMMAATFATGLVWWANLVLALGPLVAVASLIVSMRSPRQVVPAVLSGLVVLAYVVIWAPLIPHLTFRDGG